MTKLGIAIQYALTLYGVEEVAGTLTNSIITLFFKDAGHPEILDDETPWCAAFLNAILHRCQLPTTGRLDAVSFLQWGKQTVSPMYGDIVVFEWPASEGGGHHVGIVVAVYKTIVYVLGGNEQKMVEIRGYNPAYVMQYRRLDA